VSRLTWVPDQELRFDFGYGTVTLYGPTFQTARLSKLHSRVIPTGPRNPRSTRVDPVWANPLSLATTNGITACFLFLQVLRCFTSLGLLRTAMNLPYGTAVLPAVGFPIRTSTDQSLVGGSPWLIAATHVLRRLLEPRHPPHTLSSLVTLNSDLPSLAARATPSRGRDPDPVSGNMELAKTSLCDVLLTLRIRLSECFGGRGREAPALLDPRSSGRFVELIGVEPTTSSLQSWRSTN
jgi:hypothetical protein